MIEHAGEMTLTTTVALSVVRGPVPVAKTLGAVDRLSGGRLHVAVGPGSSADDYAAVGIDFSERWPRFDESIEALRSLWRPDEPPFVGRFYSTEGLSLRARARPARWAPRSGSAAGGRRPDFAAWPALPTVGSRRRTTRRRRHSATPGRVSARTSSHTGRTPTDSPTRLRPCGATSPTTSARPSASSPNECCRPSTARGNPARAPTDRTARAFAEKLTAFADAGVQRVFIWPVADEVNQLERFWDEVRPLVSP